MMKEIGQKKPSVSAQNKTVNDHESTFDRLVQKYMIAHKEYFCEHMNAYNSFGV